MKFLLNPSLVLVSIILSNLSINKDFTSYTPIPQEVAVVGVPVMSQDTVKLSDEFTARLELMSKEEGGRKIPFYASFSLEVVIGETSRRGRITFPKEAQIFRAGDKRVVSVKLSSSTELLRGQVFEVKELGRKIGVGTILEVLK